MGLPQGHREWVIDYNPNPRLMMSECLGEHFHPQEQHHWVFPCAFLRAGTGKLVWAQHAYCASQPRSALLKISVSPLSPHS